MSSIQIDELQPGMVLASDAVCLNGRVLLRSGAKLTEQHLKVFRTWGITEVDIEGADAGSLHDKKLAAADPAIVERAHRVLDERFRHVNKDQPLIAELYRWCLEHAVEDKK